MPGLRWEAGVGRGALVYMSTQARRRQGAGVPVAYGRGPAVRREALLRAAASSAAASRRTTSMLPSREPLRVVARGQHRPWSMKTRQRGWREGGEQHGDSQAGLPCAKGVTL